MIGARPTLAQVQSTVGSEQWLAALALANLSDDVRKDLARWTAWGDCGTYTYDGDARTFHPDAIVDWEGVGARRGEERPRLVELSMAAVRSDRCSDHRRRGGPPLDAGEARLVAAGRAGNHRRVGGGNNRDRGGRYKVVPA